MSMSKISGYVYLIGTPIFGWYKIGKSKTPEVRVKDLGILLPFKLHIIGVWKAANHNLMESSLHDIYSEFRINGEWFEFTKSKAEEVFLSIPAEARIYPVEKSNHPLDRFSNIEHDIKHTPSRDTTRRVIGVRCEKLRGEFTPEERAEKRIAGIRRAKQRREEKEVAKNLQAATSAASK